MPFFSPRQLTKRKSSMQDILKEMNGIGPGELVVGYRNILASALEAPQTASELIGYLIDRVKVEGGCIHTLIKMYTLLVVICHQVNYSEERVQQLETMQPPKISEKCEHREWIAQLSSHLCQYLARIPSIEDVMVRSMSFSREKTADNRSNFSDIFRIVNVLNLLLVGFNFSTCVIGRYYSGQFPEYGELFRSLVGQLLPLYSYLQFLTSHVLLCYRQFNEKELVGFMETVPSLELCCDKLENVLLNKYYRNRRIEKKIIFCEESLAQIRYYLQYDLLAEKNRLKKLSQQQTNGNPQLNRNPQFPKPTISKHI